MCFAGMQVQNPAVTTKASLVLRSLSYQSRLQEGVVPDMTSMTLRLLSLILKQAGLACAGQQSGACR